jgi:protein tyrosine/serine phosphatase
VVPGKFLAGHHPCDGDPELARRNLKALLHAGIRIFINLMAEEEKDYGCGHVEPYEDMLAELAAGMGVVVTCIRMPIDHLGVPEEEHMRAILNAIDAAIESDYPVYVHCWGGKGRTGTVVGCYLARHGLATGEEALTKIADLRQHDPKVHQSVPETEQQRQLIRSWKVGY